MGLLVLFNKEQTIKNFKTACLLAFYHKKNPKRQFLIEGSSWIELMQGGEELLQIQVTRSLGDFIYVDLISLWFQQRSEEERREEVLCNAFEKLMHEKFQMSSMGELIFFLGLQVKQKKGWAYLFSQDKYVAKILKKFGLQKSRLQAHQWKLKSLCSMIEMCVPVLDTKSIQRHKLITAGEKVNDVENPLNDEESFGEDASKQGRIDAIDADEEITLVSVHDMNVSAGEEVAEEVVEVINTAKLIVDARLVAVVGCIVSTASAATIVSAATTTIATIATITTVDDITLAQALEEMKSIKPKKKGIVIQELGESTTIIPSQQLQDNGKGKLIEPVKKKDQILLDEETALNLQAEFDEEERLAREKAEKEQEANIALLQAQEQEELSVEEKAILFQKLLEKRRKHFAAKRAKEKRNKPPIKAQQRKIMCIYLKNMEGYKLNDLKLKEFDSIQEMFDRALKRVNTFEDFRTELVEGKEKRSGIELAQEITKKQKVENDKKTIEIKKLKEIIPDEEEVAIDVIPLTVKSPSIVGWKIHKKGRKSYYQIMRADGKSQMYMIFSHMLKSFDMEDLKTLYKLVKAKYESTRLMEESTRLQSVELVAV
ncbi:reverse transcriptase domain-containing protein [Tanacetum coccineum]